MRKRRISPKEGRNASGIQQTRKTVSVDRWRCITVEFGDAPAIPAGPRISQVLDDITSERRWPAMARHLLQDPGSTYFRQALATYWITAGHHIRGQIGDERIVAELLRLVLPPYTGEAMVLYRGENALAYESGRIGFAWTPDMDVARMFGRGLNASPGGGLLLKARFAPGGILSGPNKYSLYLGERQYTTDPFAEVQIEVVERFPASE